MFEFIAFTQQTANWLLRNSDCLAAFTTQIDQIISLTALKDTVLSIGSLRISASKNWKIIGVWNTEYLSGTGQEDWGIISLSQSTGITGNEKIIGEVFERCLHVIDLRLQGLLLEEALIHEKLDDSVHRCLAGRGNEGRQNSVGYYETNVEVGSYKTKSIIISGPFRDKSELVRRANESKILLKPLLEQLESLVIESIRRPVLENSPFNLLEGKFQPALMPCATVAFGDVKCLEKVSEHKISVPSSEMTYDGWMSADSPLLDTQRRIIDSDVLLRQPIRIIGAAGSGKTLLMQLLAIKRLREAKKADQKLKILFIVHNTSMMENVWGRFVNLRADEFLTEGNPQELHVSTLSELGTEHLGLDIGSIIDKDAYGTRLFQLDTVKDCLEEVLTKTKIDFDECPLLNQVVKNKDIIDVFSLLVSAEIGIAIKGHNLSDNRRKYVDSEQRLSRLHGAITRCEREIIFDVFQAYHNILFEQMELLDSDDLAISYLGSLKTPLWQMKRKKVGYDFVFVDETQLFNENERRIFPLLSKGDKSYVPVALSLDESQELNGAISAGFGRLGIEFIADENLYAVHRSTKDILALAFHIIQYTTDLFGNEFPDFTTNTVSIVPDDHKLANKPTLVTSKEPKNLSKFILKQISFIRKQNIRQIAVIIHADRYWSEIVDGLKKERSDLVILTRRGEKLNAETPMTVLSRPESVGGQEFDAVIAVGIEQGLVPPTVDDHHGGLLVAFEQKALREMYLSFTRARYQLLIANNYGSVPSTLLKTAISTGLLTESEA